MPRESSGVIELSVVLTPGFNGFATMGFIDPFRAANYLEGRKIFRWRFFSETGGVCLSSNGIGVQTEPISASEGEQPNIVLISSSWAPEAHATKKIQFALRGWARQGATVAGLDTGAFIMAQSGLLKNRRATVHYEHIDALQETYPTIQVVEDLFAFDGAFLSCCGGEAAVDFALHILQGACGAALANAAARYIFHPKLREHGTRQHPDGAEPLGAAVPTVVKRVIQIMENHLEETLTIPEICAQVDVSHRQINRLFALYIKKTPALYYRDIRLDRARGLVTQTELPMSEISVASGFASQVHFSRAYKDRFGLPPIRDRVEGRVPFEFRAWPMYRKAPKSAQIGEN